MQRNGSAAWCGGLKAGKGTLTTASGVLSATPYSFTTGFENTPGTNPEELIAAAHAGCSTMALGAQLGNAGLTPEKLETAATVTRDRADGNWTITRVHPDLTARVPGASQAAFESAAANAKAGCPVSLLLKAEITLAAKLAT